MLQPSRRPVALRALATLPVAGVLGGAIGLLLARAVFPLDASAARAWPTAATALACLLVCVATILLLRIVRMARREAADSQHRLEQIADALDEVFWLAEPWPSMRLIFVNSAYQRVFGRPPAEYADHPDGWLGLLHPADRAAVETWGVVDATSGPREIEFRILRPDGAVRWLRARAFPVLDAEGRLLHVAGVTADVTDLKLQAEEISQRVELGQARLEALQEAEAKSRALIQAIPDVLLEFTADFVCVARHAGRPEELLLSASQIVGRNLREFASPALYARAVAVADEARRTRRAVTFEFSQEKDGRVYESEARVVWLETGSLLCMVRDIDARKRQEEALQKARADAEAASRAKGEFLATMSHEIRTPLNALIGMTGLLQDEALPPRAREHVDVIRSSGDALLALINDILDFSKIEAGKLVIETHPFHVAALLEEVVQLLAERANVSGNTLSCEVATEVPPTVLGDAGRVRQILLNLVGNAVKFTRNGTIDVRVRAERSPEGLPMLHFEVADTGIGIPEEVQPRLFEAFTQADASTTRQFGGTGLGLAVTRRLTQLMGGTVGVSSRLGEGSRFWFSIPLRAGKAGIDTPRWHAPMIAAEPLRMRILVAEDNPVNQRLTSMQLHKLGCRCELVANGEEALEALRSGPYDLILMDCQMPVMDGLAATREIRRREAGRPRIPIVALTANAMLGDRERCLEAGMDGYLAKPVRLETLRAALEPYARDEKETPPA